MAVNVYLPHFRERAKTKFLWLKKSKLSGAEDYEKEVDSVLRKYKVIIL